jgi:hypothetical protein
MLYDLNIDRITELVTVLYCFVLNEVPSALRYKSMKNTTLCDNLIVLQVLKLMQHLSQIHL